MKNLFLFTALLSLSHASLAGDLSPSQERYIDKINKAISTSSSKLIKESLISQANDAIAISGEAKQFLKVHHGNIDLHDFKTLYSEAMKSGELHKFKNALSEHGGKSVLMAASHEYKNKDHGCEVSLDSYGIRHQQELHKLTVTCMPTVYGMSHWVPVTQKIKDVYYLSVENGTEVLEQVEFGLLNSYSQNIESLLKEIDKSLNEEFI
ncbi:hypothetical protein QX249_08675 [Vibrio parahaemolyticus]|uniref:Uncharacterized protein n=1 Tax=Vibrio parahaemolyticus TaxID=670 RepID=A0AAW8PYT6_VIBPH|nr:hypothetical protein [Vibrio parahaemolyticus]EGR2229334.1 hypothetical protein [Vibrio parahaemolyticus]MDS1820731.1 hypothetical protein [Vibrio parahaemolyticus]